MSRNLGRRDCRRCGKPYIKLTERPRPVTVDDTGSGMFAEFEGMLVAHAACWICGARFLAWVDERPRLRSVGMFTRWAEPVSVLDPGGYFDLSYRSTFNDEPGEDDLPPYHPDAVEPLVTEALFLISRAQKAAREDPDRRISLAQQNNLRVAEYELLGAWDCRNDYPRHGSAERSKTDKYGGTGANFEATYMTNGQLYLNEKDQGETQWWLIHPDDERNIAEEIGAFILKILVAKLETLRAEGRLY